MKKILVSALTTSMLFSATATTFAAENPFSDVPAGHWAYDAVAELARDGVIEGYGDGTFRGNRSITRYEMAQMVARALAKKNSGSSNFSGDGAGMSEEEVRAIVEEYSLTPEEVRTIVEEYLNEGSALTPEEVRVIVEDYLNENESGSLTVEEVRNLIDDRLNGRSGMTAEDAKKIEARFNRHEILLNKLKVEFESELENLGVRVEELEKHADKVKWQGKIEYEYDNIRTDPGKTGHKDKETVNGYIFRLEPSAEVNDHWSLHARIDTYVNTKEDNTEGVELIRSWAEGDYDNFNIKLGRQEFWTNESSLVWDNHFSGAVLTFGNKFQTTLLAGRFSDKVGGGINGEIVSNDDPADIQGVNLQYNAERGLSLGAGWYNVKDDDLKTVFYSKSGTEDTANIWSVNGGYRFGSKTNLWGAYAKNSKADYENTSWQVQLDFGNYVSDYGLSKGDWGLWAGYRRYGTNVSFSPLEDDVMKGTKGWFVGGAYAPMNNFGFVAKYFNGEYIRGGGDAEKLMLLMELFY